MCDHRINIKASKITREYLRSTYLKAWDLLKYYNKFALHFKLNFKIFEKMVQDVTSTSFQYSRIVRLILVHIRDMLAWLICTSKIVNDELNIFIHIYPSRFDYKYIHIRPVYNQHFRSAYYKFRQQWQAWTLNPLSWHFSFSLLLSHRRQCVRQLDFLIEVRYRIIYSHVLLMISIINLTYEWYLFRTIVHKTKDEIH